MVSLIIHCVGGAVSLDQLFIGTIYNIVKDEVETMGEAMVSLIIIVATFEGNATSNDDSAATKIVATATLKRWERRCSL